MISIAHQFKAPEPINIRLSIDNPTFVFTIYIRDNAGRIVFNLYRFVAELFGMTEFYASTRYVIRTPIHVSSCEFRDGEVYKIDKDIEMDDSRCASEFEFSRNGSTYLKGTFFFDTGMFCISECDNELVFINLSIDVETPLTFYKK
jgi:hypothetical protein